MLSGKGPDQKQDCPFKFFSFLQCTTQRQHSKSLSNDSTVDSGIGADKNNRSTANITKDGIIVIDDDDDVVENNIEFELLCEVEFDTAQQVPLPIEEKVMCKVESEILHETSALKSKDLENIDVEGALNQANLGECEDELLPLSKLEPDCDLGEVGSTGASRGSSKTGGNNYILFICPQCGDSFETSTTWHEHIAKQHNLLDQRTYNFKQRPNNEFECLKCQAVITRCTLKTLQQHHFTHLPYKIYKCKLCRFEASRLYFMISHIMLHKDHEELGAAVFAQKGSNTTSQMRDALEHESRQFIAYVCPACGITFDSEDTWQAHINFRHNFLEKTAENRYDDHFKCCECGVEIFSQHIPDLQLHLFTHLPHKSFLKCKLCNWTISRKNFMISHIFNLHKNHLSTTANKINTTTTPMAKTSLTDSYTFDYDLDDDNNIEKSQLPSTTTTILTSSAPSIPLSSLSKSLLPDINSTRNVELHKRYSLPIRVTSPPLQHLATSHPYVEPAALTTAANHNASINHKSSNERFHKYKCKACPESFRLKVDMKRHRCMKEEMQCNKCFKEYSYEKSYYNHIRRCRVSLPQKQLTTRRHRNTFSMSDDDSD